MTRSEFDTLIQQCRKHGCVAGEKQAMYALTLWQYGCDERARKQRDKARETYYTHMNIWPQ